MRYLMIPLILALAGMTGCESENKPGSGTLPDSCFQPPESGICRASIPRYYYDANTGACQTFIWGGCQGSVPFDTMDACVNTCNGHDPAKASIKETH